jgi:eukaryotic-like serine/threonine-protein kinase
VLVVDWGVARLLAPNAPRPATDLSPAASAPHAAPESPRALGAPVTEEERTADGLVVGTPGYMPPEQATGAARDADQRADVFGLGAILKDLLGISGDETPRPLAAIVARATAPSPADRYPTATALATDVQRWLDAEPVDAYRENPFERATRFYVRNRPLILLLLTYAIIRVTILLWRGV